MYRDWREVTGALLARSQRIGVIFDMFAKEKEIIASGEKFLKVLKTEDLKGMQSLASVKNGNETVAPVAATEKSYRSLYLWDLLELWCVSFFFLFLSVFSAFLSFPQKQVKSLLALAHIHGFGVLEATIVLEKLQYLSEMWLRFVSL